MEVLVSEQAVADIRSRATAALPFETGGVVLGTYTDRGVWITEFAEINSTSPHLTRYRIPAGRTHEIVNAARSADDRVGYLGDWHTHPADLGPSARDFGTLQDLAIGALRSRRLLALARRTAADWVLDMWALNRLRRPVLVRHMLVGPLSPRDPTS